jgi:hypothetical protein
MLVQAFVPQPPIERLDVRVLVRLARLDESQLDAIAMRPGEHCLAGELRAVVRLITEGLPRNEQ